MTMPRHLKPIFEFFVPLAQVLTMGALAMGVMSMAYVSAAFADDAVKPASKRFTEPMAGPELQSPLSDPEAASGSNAGKKNGATAPDDPGADLAYGAFQRGYFLTAFKLALPRAESGDPAAQTLIAELYWNGFGIAKDQKKAVDWYRFAAEGGNKEAQFAYANILLRGKVVDTDKERGTDFMRKSAKQGHAQANFNLAQIITASRPTWGGFKAALPHYTFAANANVADAQYALAIMHARAQGVPYTDTQKAVYWMTRAAKGGFD
ncbi:MAG: tetratricopeptide repeat protein, partial [Pseudomonadota bacterium]